MPAPRRPSEPPDPADLLRGRLMADSLTVLLDQVRGSRQVLPHLGALERALKQRGARAVGQIPAHWVGKIGAQLWSLPIADDDQPLNDLLNRLLAQMESLSDEGERFDIERTAVIREVTLAEFEAAEAAEQAELPPPLPAPAA